MKKFKSILWIPLTIIGSILLGAILLMAAYMLPTGRIQNHVAESVNILVGEGDYHEWQPGDTTSRSDNYTDCIMLNSAMYDGAEGIVEKAMIVPRYRTDAASVTQELSAILENISETDRLTYGRYWHGYLVLLKPLLEFLNLQELRWLNAFVGASLVMLICIMMYKYFGSIKYAIAFLISVFFLNPMVLYTSLQYSTSYYVILIECLMALSVGDHLRKKNKFGLLFLLSGIVVAYVDLLTYPVATLGMLLILDMLMYQADIKAKILEMIQGTFLWGLGYAGMWSGKWLLANLLTDYNVMQDAMGSAVGRVGIGMNAMDAIRQNLFWTSYNSVKIIMLLILFMLVLLLLTKRIIIRIDWSMVVPLLIICCVPFVRYALLKNHSFVHSWFTYRECVVLIMGIVTLVFSCFKRGEKIEYKDAK